MLSPQSIRQIPDGKMKLAIGQELLGLDGCSHGGITATFIDAIRTRLIRYFTETEYAEQHSDMAGFGIAVREAIIQYRSALMNLE